MFLWSDEYLVDKTWLHVFAARLAFIVIFEVRGHSLMTSRLTRQVVLWQKSGLRYSEFLFNIRVEVGE